MTFRCIFAVRNSPYKREQTWRSVLKKCWEKCCVGKINLPMHKRIRVFHVLAMMSYPNMLCEMMLHQFPTLCFFEFILGGFAWIFFLKTTWKLLDNFPGSNTSFFFPNFRKTEADNIIIANLETGRCNGWFSSL